MPLTILLTSDMAYSTPFFFVSYRFFSSFMTYNFVTRVKHVTSEAGTACPSGAPEFTQESNMSLVKQELLVLLEHLSLHSIFSGVRVAQS